MSVIQSDIPSSVKVGDFTCIGKNVFIGENTRISSHCNIYGAKIGQDCMVGSMVEIQSDSTIGDRTRIQSHSFICSNTTIGKNVFLAHGIMTVNDTFSNGQVNFDKKDWSNLIIEDDVIVGSGAILFPVTIGKGSIVGSGAVVLSDVKPYSTVVGNPAREIKRKQK